MTGILPIRCYIDTLYFRFYLSEWSMSIFIKKLYSAFQATIIQLRIRDKKPNKDYKLEKQP